MASVMFKRAVRERLILRLGFCGPSGSGKSLTALKVAHVLADGKTFAVIDSERESSKVYAGPEWKKEIGDFDMCSLAAPYTPERYVELIQEAEKYYPVIVVDSGTQEWDGEGGILAIVDAAGKRRENSGNKFAAWKEGDARHAAFFRAILQCKAHIIVTFRSKQEYAQVEKDGRKTVEKLGMSPITRAGYEYELDVVGDLDIAHTVVFNKTRCPALDGRTFNRAGKELGEFLLTWANSGERTEIKPPEAPPAAPPAPVHTVTTSAAVPQRKETPAPNTQPVFDDDALAGGFMLRLNEVETAMDMAGLDALYADIKAARWKLAVRNQTCPFATLANDFTEAKARMTKAIKAAQERIKADVESIKAATPAPSVQDTEDAHRSVGDA